MTYKENPVIKKGSMVKSTSKTDAYGYSIEEGTVLEIIGADYDDYYTLYQLKESDKKESTKKTSEFWAYEFSLEVLV